MPFLRFALALLLVGTIPLHAQAQSDTDTSSQLFLELNKVQDTSGACRLTFVAQNKTGSAIDEAVFETVIFDTSGGVVTLSLFDFRDLPADRPRVRQFDLPGIACSAVGQALINGANTCIIDGTESGVCREALSLSSRIEVELLG